MAVSFAARAVNEEPNPEKPESINVCVRAGAPPGPATTVGAPSGTHEDGSDPSIDMPAEVYSDWTDDGDQQRWGGENL